MSQVHFWFLLISLSGPQHSTPAAGHWFENKYFPALLLAVEIIVIMEYFSMWAALSF